jgi:hypothetical protein
VSAEALIEKARSDFLAQIIQAKRLMNDTVQYRHIVVVSIGDISTQYFQNMADTVTSIIGSGTIDLTGVQWRGIDIGATEPAGMSQSLSPYFGFNFPMFFPATVQLSVKTTDQPYLFPLDGVNPGPFAVSIRSQAQWDTVFNWTGFASNGAVTAATSTKPWIFSAPLDSGLAKVWAKDPSHIADREEIYPGGTFGIVTKATYLQATTKNISADVAHSVPFLTDDEIHTARTAVKKVKNALAAKNFAMVFHAGILIIRSPIAISKIEVFDLTGKLIMTIDPLRYIVAQGQYRIPLKSILHLKGIRAYIVRVSGVSLQKIITINLEGLR